MLVDGYVGPQRRSIRAWYENSNKKTFSDRLASVVHTDDALYVRYLEWASGITPWYPVSDRPGLGSTGDLSGAGVWYGQGKEY